MCAVLVEVADILGKKSAKVALVGEDDMIEQFAATASYPMFGHTVLPRTAPGRAQRFHPHLAERGQHLQSVFRIAIEDQVPRLGLKRKRLP